MKNEKKIWARVIIACIAALVVTVLCFWYTKGRSNEIRWANAQNLIIKNTKESIGKIAMSVGCFGTDNPSTSQFLESLREPLSWRIWESWHKEFKVRYPLGMEVVNQSTSGDGFVLQSNLFGQIRYVAFSYADSMSVEEKYEALKQGSTTSSVGDDYFLLAGKMGDNMRFFEKDVKGKKYWYYLRVEFPAELAAAIDPLLQYVKEYQLAEAFMR